MAAVHQEVDVLAVEPRRAPGKAHLGAVLQPRPVAVDCRYRTRHLIARALLVAFRETHTSEARAHSPGEVRTLRSLLQYLCEFPSRSRVIVLQDRDLGVVLNRVQPRRRVFARRLDLE